LAGDRELLPGDALQVFHRADRDAFGVENRALLDVQLDERVRTVEGYRRGSGVADAVELRAQRLAVDGDRGQALLERKAAGVDERAQHVRGKARALLVRVERDHQGTPGRQAGGIERGHHLESRENTQVAVVTAAGADRVDVRPGHHRGQRLRARAQSEHVADAVDGHVQSLLAHPAHDAVTTLLVVVRQGEAAGAAALDRTDLRKRRKPRHEAPRIDPQIGGLRGDVAGLHRGRRARGRTRWAHFLASKASVPTIRA
jgi:hypothetical protein